MAIEPIEKTDPVFAEFVRQIAHNEINAIVEGGRVFEVHSFYKPTRKVGFKRRVIREVIMNIGRNDPCPCGSGKKYKKCCKKGEG